MPKTPQHPQRLQTSVSKPPERPARRAPMRGPSSERGQQVVIAICNLPAIPINLPKKPPQAPPKMRSQAAAETKIFQT